MSTSTQQGTGLPSATRDPAADARHARPASAPARPPAAGAGGRPALPAAVDVVVLVGALGLALLPLLPVFGAAALLRPGLGGLVLGTALALVSAARRWTVLGTAAVAVALAVVAGPALAVPDAALAGLVPTPAAVVLVLTGAVSAWKQVLTLEPVLGSAGNVMMAPFLLALVGSLLAVGLARRRSGAGSGAGGGGFPGGAPATSPAALAGARRGPTRGAWAAVVPLVVLGVAVLLGTKTTVGAQAGGAVLALALLVWAAWRRGTLAVRRGVALGAMVVVAGLAGSLAGPLLAQDHPRFVLRDQLVPPFDPRDHPSPLSGFRTFVKEWKDTDLLTVRGLPEGASVRLATLDAFDGVVWNVAGAEAAEGSGEFRRVGETIDTTVAGRAATVELEAHQLPSVWLPTVGYTREIDFAGPRALELAGELRYNDATGTAVLTGGIPAGTRWTAEVVVPAVPEDEELADATTGSVPLPEPEGVPDAVPLYAGEIAGTASSPLLVARTLEAGLAERGWFSHGLVEAGDEPSLSGHGASRITTLLTGELMVGDSEQYASAMALMAREMGLPARVVLGLTPDEEEAGDPTITLTGDDIEAWVEVHFAQAGWVPFRPTPDESRTPREDTPEEAAEPQPQVAQRPPPPADPVTPPDDDTEQPRTQPTDDVIETVRDWRPVIVAATAVAVPLLLVLGPLALIAAAKRRRRRRRRSAGDPVARVVGGWDEVLDEARDLRRPPPPLSTRREIAVRLTEAFGTGVRRDTDAAVGERRAQLVGAPVAGLAAGADAMVFGRGEPSPQQVEAYWQQVEATLGVMRSAVPRRQRWRGRWSTASLRARRAERRAR